MRNQEIPNSGGDNIKNVNSLSWKVGACPPKWAEPTLLVFKGEVLKFSDDKVLTFKDYK